MHIKIKTSKKNHIILILQTKIFFNLILNNSYKNLKIQIGNGKENKKEKKGEKWKEKKKQIDIDKVEVDLEAQKRKNIQQVILEPNMK